MTQTQLQKTFEANAQKLQQLRDSYNEFVTSGQKPNVPFHPSQLVPKIRCSKCKLDKPKSQFNSEELRNQKDQASLCRSAKIYCQDCETPRFWARRAKKGRKSA
jgi:hypothetical protein